MEFNLNLFKYCKKNDLSIRTHPAKHSQISTFSNELFLS